MEGGHRVNDGGKPLAPHAKSTQPGVRKTVRESVRKAAPLIFIGVMALIWAAFAVSAPAIVPHDKINPGIVYSARCQGGLHPSRSCVTCEHCAHCGRDKGRSSNQGTCVVCEKSRAAEKQRPTQKPSL